MQYPVMDTTQTLFLLLLLICLCNRAFCVCPKGNFRCTSGDCISQTLACDGHPHCGDSSDETFRLCSRPDFSCPGFAFRCSYGACVSGDAVCNGTVECADGSDEQQQRCPGVILRPDKHNCGHLEFPCLQHDQCIKNTDVCDGKKDCDDGSDETILQCSEIECARFAFRCAYGACVAGDSPCNGSNECFDGSDEFAPQCKSVNVNLIPKPTVTPSTPPGGSHVPTSSSCFLPEIPDNGSYVVLVSTAGKWLPGTAVAQNTQLFYKCNEGYRLVSKKNVEPLVRCINGQWTPELPSCSSDCDELDTEKFRLSCYDGLKNSISCQGKLPANTSVTFKCGTDYRNSIHLNYDTIYCKNSEWDPPLSNSYCEIVCGRSAGFAEAFINLPGSTAEPLHFRWHAGIYELLGGESKRWEQTCAGSLVKPQVVISAAHCFIKKSTVSAVQVKNASLFQVGLGKYFRSLDNPDDDEFAQIVAVLEIILPVDFGGKFDNYVDDIALIILKEEAKYTPGVAPVCIVLDATDEEEFLLEGPAGEVVGWGKVNETVSSSEVLRYAEIPFVARSQCRENINTDLRKFVSGDKMCGLDKETNQTVCNGDSGGGYVFLDESTNQYTLRGIVSVGDQLCTGQDYVLFTKVSAHAKFLRDNFAKLGLTGA